MKLFHQITRPSSGLASAHGFFSLSLDSPPLTGIGLFGLASKPGRPEQRKLFLEHLRAQLARRSSRRPS